jgi:hypothetical protein
VQWSQSNESAREATSREKAALLPPRFSLLSCPTDLLLPSYDRATTTIPPTNTGRCGRCVGTVLLDEERKKNVFVAPAGRQPLLRTACTSSRLRSPSALPPSSCTIQNLFNRSTSNSSPLPPLVQTYVSGPGLHTTHLTAVSLRLISSAQSGGWRRRKSGEEGEKEARFVAEVVVEKSA